MNELPGAIFTAVCLLIIGNVYYAMFRPCMPRFDIKLRGKLRHWLREAQRVDWLLVLDVILGAIVVGLLFSVVP